DVDIQEYGVPVAVLLLDQILEVAANGAQRFWQTRLLVDHVSGKIECGHARVREAIDDVWLQQTTVRGDVDPESLPSGVVHQLVDEFRPEEDLTTHESEDAAGRRMQPVDRGLRDLLGHAFHPIVVRVAVVAIEIAFVLGKQVSDDGMEIARQQPRLHVRKRPAPQRMVDLPWRPVPLSIAWPGIIGQQLRPARKWWLWQAFSISWRRERRRRTVDP